MADRIFTSLPHATATEAHRYDPAAIRMGRGVWRWVCGCVMLGILALVGSCDCDEPAPLTPMTPPPPTVETLSPSIARLERDWQLDTAQPPDVGTGKAPAGWGIARESLSLQPGDRFVWECMLAPDSPLQPSGIGRFPFATMEDMFGRRIHLEGFWRLDGEALVLKSRDAERRVRVSMLRLPDDSRRLILASHPFFAELRALSYQAVE